VIPCYERLGWRTHGPEFVEASIPHRAVRKRDPSAPAGEGWRRLAADELRGPVAELGAALRRGARRIEPRDVGGVRACMNRTDGWFSDLRSSQFLRVVMVGFLALLLQLPIGMVGRLVQERQLRRDEAVEGVTSKWGRAQRITGPALVVPYAHRWREPDAEGVPRTQEVTRHAVFLPDRLAIRGDLASEVRERGIFTVPVYHAKLELAGEIQTPDLATLGIDPARVDWKHAELSVGISDLRAIRDSAPLVWRGRNVALLPGTGRFGEAESGIHATVDASPGEGALTFTLPLALAGSLGISFTPMGRETEVALASSAAGPSFQGNWLPAEREARKDGFRALWKIPFLGRGFPQAWTSTDGWKGAVDASQFGVELRMPVDPYRMSERSVKYAGLFILWTFATVWLVETLGRVRAHPLQYLLIGAALCLFYLLELSLAEHVGFGRAYALASLAVIVLVSVYARAVLGGTGRAAIVGAAVAALYGHLLVLLTNEDHALLAGSLALLVSLAAIMFVTRRVDWYALGVSSPPASSPRSPSGSR
jgi:inner membrane protein